MSFCIGIDRRRRHPNPIQSLIHICGWGGLVWVQVLQYLEHIDSRADPRNVQVALVCAALLRN